MCRLNHVAGNPGSACGFEEPGKETGCIGFHPWLPRFFCLATIPHPLPPTAEDAFHVTVRLWIVEAPNSS